MVGKEAHTSAGDRSPDTSSRLLPMNRLEAFSDGVFAIVVTLLVLELAVPEGAENLGHELVAEWPAYLGYIVSFTFIGGSWISHSTATSFMKAADAVLMRLNLVLLLFVSFLPFSTSLMATHLGGAGERLSVVLFGLDLTLAALLVNVVFGYAGRNPRLVADGRADEELRSFAKERRVALVSLALATLVGVFLPVMAVMFFLLVSVLMLVDPLWRARRRRTAHQQASADG